MTFARRHAAARNAIAAAVALAMPLATACAESGSDLLLPLMTAIALASIDQGYGGTPQSPLTAVPAPRRQATLLPSQLRIPDGYAVDIDVPRPRYVVPVDSDRIVAVDLFRRRRRGWMASLAYDEEARRPLPGSSQVLSLTAELRF
jgi:hypothetical protein